MATDDDYNIGPFQRIIDVSFAGGALLYFCPVYNQNNGWGAPFQSGDPLEDVNPPFGTALTSSDDHDDRHKIANVSSLTVATTFGDQLAQFPGNNHWTDGTKYLNWWGISCWGIDDVAAEDIDYTSWAHTQVGDCGLYCRMTGDGYICTIAITSSRLTALTFNTVDIDTINDRIYVNNIKYTLPTFHPGRGGRYIAGCGMIGDWIIYIDINATSVYLDYNTEYVNAYNIETTEYRLLGTFQTESTGQYFLNMMNIAFSQDGLSFITDRTVGLIVGPESLRIIRGSITLDEFDDPLSASVSIDSEQYPFHPFYYGYKDNIEDVRYWQSANSDLHYTYLSNWDVQTGFALGTVHKNDQTPVLRYLFVMFDDIIYLYTIDGTTGLTDYSSPAATYNGWTEYVNGLPSGTIDINSNNQLFSSVAIIDTGVFFSIRRNQHIGWIYPVPSDQERLNLWIKPDGTGVDLGETLLDNTVNGGLLSCNPMTVSNV